MMVSLGATTNEAEMLTSASFKRMLLIIFCRFTPDQEKVGNAHGEINGTQLFLSQLH